MDDISNRPDDEILARRLAGEGAQILWKRGQAKFDARYGVLKAEYAEADAAYEDSRANCLAVIEDPVPGNTTEARERGENKAIARKNVQMHFAEPLTNLLLVGATLALVVGGVVATGIELAMYFDIFRSMMANEFGEVSNADGAWALFLAFQPVLAMLAIKIWAVNTRRTEWVAAAAFVGAVGLAVGAVLKTADDYVREAGTADGSLTWDTLPNQIGQGAELFGVEWSGPLLALGFLVVPLVSALLIGIGWTMLKSALKARAEARFFRSEYASMKEAAHMRTQIGLAIKQHDAAREEIISAPLNAVIQEKLDDAERRVARVRKHRQSGLEGKAPVRTDESDGLPVDDCEAVEQEAEATRSQLGNGFAKDAYKARREGRNHPPPP